MDTLKRSARASIRRVGGQWLVPAFEMANWGVRRFAALTHQAQIYAEWITGHSREWFDHNLDLYYQWHKTGNPLWLERGIFNLLCIRDGARVLELCCGGGFNARYFYAIRAKSIDAMDFGAEAIAQAMTEHRAPNIRFRVGDIRTEMPAGPYDNVIWDAAIEHFTQAEIEQLIPKIKGRLALDGTLSGYTIIDRHQHGESHYHEREFISKEDLASLFTPHFGNVWVFETVYPNRHNLYFWASDGSLPFDSTWPAQVHLTRGEP